MSNSMILDGKAIAGRVRAEVAQRVSRLAAMGITPRLEVVLVGDDPASRLYVRNKERACAEVGIEGVTSRLPADVSTGRILDTIERLNRDPAVDGILVQLPLPPGMDAASVTPAIDPAKDVDGFHPLNLGLLLAGTPNLVPCTAAGILRLIDETGIDLARARATVVGRSLTVGRPTALLLLARHATVTLCHSRTRDMRDAVAAADVLVVAAGRPGLVPGAWVKEGSVVIDVGMNRTPDGGFTGDVGFEEAAARAAFITPVPGGVGPMTVACLLENTVKAACARRTIST